MLGFDTPLRAAVIGASGGIGAALVDTLSEQADCEAVFGFSRTARQFTSSKVHLGAIDLTDEDSIAAAAEQAGSCNLVICATGILHRNEGLSPEKSYRQIDPQAMADVFAVNSIGPALVAKHFLPKLPRQGRGLFAALSARVGSISDNGLGGWHSYRASKAALNMLIQNFAIETGRKNGDLICVGLHPGTVDTSLSEPFQSGVPERQLFSPARSAAHLLEVLAGLTPEHSGRCFAWDGSEIQA